MDSRYSSNKHFKDYKGREYLVNTLYPDVPVSENDWYVITTAGDRYEVFILQLSSGGLLQ